MKNGQKHFKITLDLQKHRILKMVSIIFSFHITDALSSQIRFSVSYPNFEAQIIL